MADKPLVAVTVASSGIVVVAARIFSAAGYPVPMTPRRTDRKEAMSPSEVVTGRLPQNAPVREICPAPARQSC